MFLNIAIALLFQKTGLKNDIERLYQVSDQEIDIQFANKRLACIANVGSLRNIVQRKFQGKKNFLRDLHEKINQKVAKQKSAIIIYINIQVLLRYC